jgi:hypothetical protein
VGLSQNSAGLMGFLIIIHILIMVTSPWNSGDYIQQTDLVSSKQTYNKAMGWARR